jgi:hypothetical protein
MPQLVMVDEIRVPERDAEHRLADQRRHRMLDQLRAAAIRKAGGEAPDEPDRPAGGPEEQRSRIRGDRPAVESGLDPAACDGCKTEKVCATLCRHRGAPLHWSKALSQKSFRRFRAPMHLPNLRNPG